MKELQKMIIATAINEHQYQRVIFLEPLDFQNFPEHDFRGWYSIISSNKGDVFNIYKQFLTNDSTRWVGSYPMNAIAFVNLEKFAIYLVENRFKIVFGNLLNDLVMKSNSDIEMSMIQEFQIEITRIDVFTLADSFLEYLGHHSSDYTKSRIEAYLKWRDNRVNQIKQSIK